MADQTPRIFNVQQLNNGNLLGSDDNGVVYISNPNNPKWKKIPFYANEETVITKPELLSEVS